MHGTCFIEIATKPAFLRPEIELLEDVASLGHKSVKSIARSQLYRLVGEISAEQRQRIARELLCDPIMQTATDGVDHPANSVSKKRVPVVATVDVWYRSGVTDVVGESVLKGLQDMGVGGIEDVRTGTRYRLAGLSDERKIRAVANTFLANPLIQETTIHVG